MAQTSEIEWTDATWNPVTGCTKIGPGCDNCYAERFAERWRGVAEHPYEQGFDLTLWPSRLMQPAQWKKPRMIFVNSMSDLFHKDIDRTFIDKVFDGLVFPGWALEHAAVTETSLMLHYAPELVHMDRMVEEAGATAKSYVRYPVRQGDVPAHGGLANPAGSSAERGRLIAEACVDAVAEICAEEFGE